MNFDTERLPHGSQPAPHRCRLGGAVLILLLALSSTACFRTRPGADEAPADGRRGATEATTPTTQAAATAEPTPRAVTARGDLAEDEKATIALFRNSSPSVVYITTLARGRDRFTLNLMEVPEGSGSGFVWDRDGHVVTNYHVVAGTEGVPPSRIQVTLADHSDWDARLVGVAPTKDLAVLHIDAPRDSLPPILVGRSMDLEVGQKVFAIGNPFGLDHTLTTGIISALGRQINSMTGLPIRDVVQTDAAINPGNSGGPLLDSAGRLIGVNTAIFSPSGAYAGIGFAIPVDTVAWVVPELIQQGRLSRPTLGIDPSPDSLAREAGLQRGVLVLGVTPGSGAEKAGIRPTRRNPLGRVELGDVIVAIDDQPVNAVADLLLLLERHKPGEQVAVTLLRDGDQRSVEVTLGPPA